MFLSVVFQMDRTLLIKVLSVVLVFALGAFIGALLVLLGFKGNRKSKKISDDNEKKIKETVITAVKCGILDNLGVGIVAYDDSEPEPVYFNKYFKKFAGEDIPQNLDDFYKKYDNNEVESDRFNLLLKKRDQQHNNDEIRYTFVRDDKIYEIKNLKVHNPSRTGIAAEGYESKESTGMKLFEKMLEECNVFQIEDISNAPEHVKSQMDYSATLSHQLKTPITIITNTIEADKNIDKESYDIIMRACQRVNETAKAFTKFSQENFHFQTTPVAQCIDGALERVEFYPRRNEVNLVVNYERNDFQIFCDVECIITVIQNLITNAIKYIDYEGKTDPHEIKINVRNDENSSGNAILLEVADNGRGIPKDDLSHVFEGFFRVDRSGSQKDGGTGLGLTIVEKMTNRHLGKVQVVSSVCSGSCFMVTLPTARKIITDAYKAAKDSNESEKQIYKDASKVLASQINYALETIDVEEGKEYTPDSSLVNLVSKIDDKQFEEILNDYLVIDSFEDEFDDFDESDIDDSENDLYDESDDFVSEENIELTVLTETDIRAEESLINPEEAKQSAEEEKARNLELLREPVVQMVKRKQEIEAQRIEEENSTKEYVKSDNAVVTNEATIALDDKEQVEEPMRVREKIQHSHSKENDDSPHKEEKIEKTSKDSVMIHPEMKKSAKIKRNFFKSQEK